VASKADDDSKVESTAVDSVVSVKDSYAVSLSVDAMEEIWAEVVIAVEVVSPRLSVDWLVVAKSAVVVVDSPLSVVESSVVSLE
jgi:hypothetical protein